MFSGLLVCGAPGCGQILSSMPRPGGRQVGYYCRKAHNDPTHPRPYVVSERFLLPAIMEEIEHVDLGGDSLATAAENAAQRVNLAAQLDRANELYIAGKIGRERYDAEAAAVTAALAALGSAETVQDLGNLDDLWTWAPADTNATLRAILERVILGPDLRPLPFPDGFVWRNPKLRRA